MLRRARITFLFRVDRSCIVPVLACAASWNPKVTAERAIGVRRRVNAASTGVTPPPFKKQSVSVSGLFSLVLVTKAQRILPQWQAGCFTLHERVHALHVCARFFLWSWHVSCSSFLPERERQASSLLSSKNKNPRCSHFYCCSVPIF